MTKEFSSCKVPTTLNVMVVATLEAGDTGAPHHAIAKLGTVTQSAKTDAEILCLSFILIVLIINEFHYGKFREIFENRKLKTGFF